MRDNFAVVYLKPENFDMIVIEIGGSKTKVLLIVEHKSLTYFEPFKLLMADFVTQT